MSHHSSYNGFDETVLEEWQDTYLYAHTGGKRDATHPDAGVLEVLESHAHDISFARTDRNGLITVRKVRGVPRLIPQRGGLNDFSKNRTPRRRPDAAAEIATRRDFTFESPGGVGSNGVVEVFTRVPHANTSVTVTIDVRPGEKKSQP